METVFTAEEIAAMVRRLAEKINGYYANVSSDDPILIVGVLKGAFVFLADLIRNLTIPAEIEFLRTSSYASSHTSSGTVRLLAEPSVSPKNRRVLIVDDMIDTGRTLAFVHDYFVRQAAAEVEIAVLLDKKARRVVDVECRFVGAEVENRFLGGYGLDGGQCFSQHPDIFAAD